MGGSCVGSRQCRVRREPTKCGCRPRIGGKSKRRGLENYQAASKTIAKPIFGILSVLLLLSALNGCAQNSFQVQDAVQTGALNTPLAPEVLMEVDDVAVMWGAGKVGDALKTTLVRNGSFSQVHFPIFPAREIANKLQITAKGGVETDAASAAGKSFATGLFLFLPVGVIQYRDVFTITAEVAVFTKGRKFGPLTIESKVAADHTMFNGPETYALQAQRMLLEDLAGRISAALADHREWFSE